MNINTVALIGFGEAGSILGADLAAQGISVQVYDRNYLNLNSRSALQAKAQECAVQLCASAVEAAENTQLIISAVTAGSALSVANELAPHLRAGQLFMDINSVAPTTKQAAHDAMQRYDVDYVDAAVMAPVPPQRLQTPILLGGRRADELMQALNGMGFNSRSVAERVGVASSIKMCRSIMIKGLEALTTECLSAARQYGAEKAVLASLHKSFPSMGWNAEFPDYLISRVAEHGRRRAEEMEEVVRTVADGGIASHMSLAIAKTQRGVVDAMRDRGLRYAELEPFDWRHLVERLYD